MKKIPLICVILIFSLTSPIFASQNQSIINEEDSPVQFFVDYEKGFVSVLSHTIQISKTSPEFNYVTQGGQDILFPFERINVGAVINDRHRVSFLYQPLEINTVVNLDPSANVKINDKAFDGTTELKYSFPFWRISYSYDLLEDKDVTLGVGAALQIRNASIVFKSTDGSENNVSQNVGLVPALHIYSMWKTPVGINLSADLTGIYASSKIINGATYEFEGSILDASLRAGYRLKNNVEMFGNFRFLGGTSNGTNAEGEFTANNLATVSSTIGITIR